MTVTMFNQCIDEIVKEYNATSNTRSHISILTILCNMHDGPLKSDKFCKKKVRETIELLNPAFASGYFKKK